MEKYVLVSEQKASRGSRDKTGDGDILGTSQETPEAGVIRNSRQDVSPIMYCISTPNTSY